MAVAQPEIWKDVPGYEGLYQVSSLGRVKSLARVSPSRNRWGECVRTIPERFIKPNPGRGPYPNICFHKNDRGKTYPLHRVICEAFHGPAPEMRPNVARNDGNTANLRASNLRWASQSENCRDKVRHGTWQGGENNANASIANSEIPKIKARRNAGELLTSIAADYGVTGSTICAIAKGQRYRLEGAL